MRNYSKENGQDKAGDGRVGVKFESYTYNNIYILVLRIYIIYIISQTCWIQMIQKKSSKNFGGEVDDEVFSIGKSTDPTSGSTLNIQLKPISSV